MKYQIINATDPEILTVEVNKALADGWKPSGSLCMQVFPTQTQTPTGMQTGVIALYAQALVHYEGK